MYIETLDLANLRTFGGGSGKQLAFVHPDKEFRPRSTPPSPRDDRLPAPRLPNVTLLLGDNGSGKTTILRAIAAAAFGPVAKDLLRDSSMVRFGESTAQIHAELRLHPQDHIPGELSLPNIESTIGLERRGERLDVQFGSLLDEQAWQPVYESRNDAFFVVGYGSTRRVERLDTYDSGARAKARAARDLRVQSLFEESFSLIPLGSWLPELKRRNPKLYGEVSHLLNLLLGPGDYRFHGEQDSRGDYLFNRGRMPVSFPSLSDGYRAFIGWVADLLHHLCFAHRRSRKLVDSRGVVLVDEIDLHLHPKWQMTVIKTVAKTLPKMQFVVTSHSPLVAGSLEWMNIIKLKVSNKTNRTTAERLREGIHGLDADQILLTEYFGMKSTRAATKIHQLTRLRHDATLGDDEAKRAYVRALASPLEPIDNGLHDDAEGDAV